MKILLIGNGGREHTLAWKLSQSPKCDKLFVIPGNPGIEEFGECVKDISITDNKSIVKFSLDNSIDLVVIGPEAPLVNGLADDLTSAQIKVFGPNKQAAQIEGSKIFAKDLMKKYNIPTATYNVFDDVNKACNFIKAAGVPIVIKADGLAGGKGVIIAQTIDEAINAVFEVMEQKNFGEAGNRIVIEEFMEGEEASLLAFTDGKTIVPMIPSQDHKRVNDNDEGLNTGGMGAYAPAPVMTEEIIQKAQDKILNPIINALSSEGITYKGCLYAGLMIVNCEPKVVEFNARFGDPETQVVLPLLESDLVDIMLACIDGTLNSQNIQWSSDSAVCIVLASGGYPQKFNKGYEIDGLNKAKSLDTLIIHAGTSKVDGKLVTNGGRVLGVVAKDKTLQSAVNKAYKAVEVIHFDNMHYRKDIAHRALK